MKTENRTSRDTRRVLTLLRSVCTDYDDLLKDTSDGYTIDKLMMDYYPAPIINIIQSKLNKMRNIQPKHGTMTYWMPMIFNMQDAIKNALRPDRVAKDWEDNPIQEIAMNRWDYITSEYLMVDYSYDEMVMLLRIVNTVDDNIIEHACAEAKHNNVFDIRYINVIIDKELAIRANARERDRQRTNEMAEQSHKIMDAKIYTHTPLDMFEVERQWKEANENAELENRFNKLINKMGW